MSEAGAGTLPAQHASAMGSGRLRWVSLGLFCVVVFVAFSLTADRSNGHMDFWSSNYASWHLVHSGNPWLDDVEIPPLDDNPQAFTWITEADNGHRVIARSPGTIAATLPAYFVAGSPAMTLVPAAVTAAALSTLAVLLLALALLTRMSTRDALVASGVFAFATPVWTIAADGVWPHTVTLVGIAGMAWGAATSRPWLVGLFGGVTLWGRLHASVIVAVVGLLWGRQRRRIAIPLVIGMLSGLFLAAMCVWSRWMYGTWDPTAAYDVGQYVDIAKANKIDVVNFLGFIVSPDRGIFVWTPILLLMMPALVRSWRSLPDWSRSLIWGGLAYTFVQAVMNRFSGGDFFYGYRLTLELLACAAPALAFSAPRMGPWARKVFAPLVGLQVAAMFVGAITRSFWVENDHMWTDNAFWLALRGYPGFVVPLATLFVAGAVVTERLLRAVQPTGSVISHSVP